MLLTVMRSKFQGAKISDLKEVSAVLLRMMQS
jgi:hypothetical protein